MRPDDFWAGVLPGIIGGVIAVAVGLVVFLVEQGCRRLWRWLTIPGERKRRWMKAPHPSCRRSVRDGSGMESSDGPSGKHGEGVF